MILFYVVLRVLIILSSSFAQPGSMDFHPEVNNEPKNCAMKESDVRLICKTNGTASRMIIKRARDQNLLYTSPRASTSADFLVEHVDCVDMGVYQCIIDSRHIATTVLVFPECPPLPCHQEGTTMSVYADVNKPLDISLCVLVYSDILIYTRINNVIVRRQAKVNYAWTWDSYENQETSACFRNVTILLKHGNWTTENYETMSVRVYSWAGNTFYLDYNISVIPAGPPQPCHQESTTMSVYADVNKPLDIYLCLLVFRGILNYIEINNVSVRRQAADYFGWTWDYYENKEISAFLINVIIALKHKNWTTGDYGGMSVRVYSSAGDTFYLDYNISVIPTGPPQPCHQESNTMSVYADVNKPLDIYLCLLVFRGILNYIEINNVSVRRQAADYYGWTWDYYENKEISAFLINVIIALKHENWTTGDYGGMIVRVYSSAGDTFYSDYNISVIPTGSRLDKETPEDKEAVEKYVIFTSPILIIIAGAVVVIVVIIVRKGSRHVVEENVVEEHVLEELPEAQAPENPLYEEIIYFPSDMPDKPVHYVNQISHEHVEEEQYEIPLPAY